MSEIRYRCMLRKNSDIDHSFHDGVTMIGDEKTHVVGEIPPEILTIAAVDSPSQTELPLDGDIR